MAKSQSTQKTSPTPTQTALRGRHCSEGEHLNPAAPTYKNLAPMIDKHGLHYTAENAHGNLGYIFSPKFEAYDKTPRLNRPIFISEKLDGTNAGIIIDEHGAVWPQSRNRMIHPGKDTDNHGFARWVLDNADILRDALGPGRHFGEWVGPKIGPRDYGLTENHLYLFNPKHAEAVEASGLDRLHIVPQLEALDTFDSEGVASTLRELVETGSHIAPTGKHVRPEGIIVYHPASGQVFKVLADNDELPKTILETMQGDVARAGAAA